MVTLSIGSGLLRVRLNGWSRVWALSGGFDVPLTNVRAASIDPALRLAPDGIRVGGTFFPGRIAAGRYWRPGFSSFWCVRDPARAVIVDLSGWRYDRVVLQVADPEAVIDEIRRALCSDKGAADQAAIG